MYDRFKELGLEVEGQQPSPLWILADSNTPYSERQVLNLARQQRDVLTARPFDVSELTLYNGSLMGHIDGVALTMHATLTRSADNPSFAMLVTADNTEFGIELRAHRINLATQEATPVANKFYAERRLFNNGELMAIQREIDGFYALSNVLAQSRAQERERRDKQKDTSPKVLAFTPTPPPLPGVPAEDY
jgi:hypothetical protein